MKGFGEHCARVRGLTIRVTNETGHFLSLEESTKRPGKLDQLTPEPLPVPGKSSRCACGAQSWEETKRSEDRARLLWSFERDLSGSSKPPVGPASRLWEIKTQSSCLVKKILRISRWQQQSIKTSAGGTFIKPALPPGPPRGK